MSHFEMSPLNFSVAGITSTSNKLSISVTAVTSQDPIGPCGPLEQSVDSFRQSAMAAWSSFLDFGAHPQSSVLGHCLGPGFVSGSQLDVVQLTAPGVPDRPAPTPHLFVAHPVGSPCTH